MPPRSCSSWRIVCLNAPPSVPTRFGDGHAHVGEEHLAEVAVGGHVLDRADLDAGCVHRHDDLADPGVRRAFRRRAADAVAVVGDGGEARPDLLPVDHPLVALPHGAGAQRRQVGAGLGLAHPDAPRRLAREDLRQELGLLVGAAVGDQRRAHLPVGEPRRGDRGAGLDHLLADDQAVDRRLAAATELGRPGQPDPAVLGEHLGEVLGVAVDPRVVEPAVPGDAVGGHLAGLLAKCVLLSGPGEVHGPTVSSTVRT